MDLQLNEMQKMLRNSAREFLAKEWSVETLKQLDKDGVDFLPQTYKQIADLGWLGLHIPEQYGGSGGSWLDTIVVFEEFGRALLRSPHLEAALAAETILRLGSDDQKKELLPGIAQGKLVFAVSTPESGAPAVKASLTESGFKIKEGKLLVRHAQAADYLLVPAAAPRKVSLFLIPLKQARIAGDALKSFNGELLAEVDLKGMAVPEANVMPASANGASFQQIVDQVQALRCAEMVGGVDACLTITVDYTKQRIQFNVPIASFEVIQHRMADSWIGVQRARWLVYYWGWLMDRGDKTQPFDDMARLAARDTYRHAAEDGVQGHGGYGVMQDFSIGRYYKQAKVAELELGPSWEIREKIVQRLGL